MRTTGTTAPTSGRTSGCCASCLETWWIHAPGGSTVGLVFKVRNEVLVLARIMIRPGEEFADFVVERRLTDLLVALARLCPSGTNKQPLKYVLSADDTTNQRIFPHLRWAGYLKDWPGPDGSKTYDPPPISYLGVFP